jgi:hypothetical protein
MVSCSVSVVLASALIAGCAPQEPEVTSAADRKRAVIEFQEEFDMTHEQVIAAEGEFRTSELDVTGPTVTGRFSATC